MPLSVSAAALHTHSERRGMEMGSTEDEIGPARTEIGSAAWFEKWPRQRWCNEQEKSQNAHPQDESFFLLDPEKTASKVASTSGNGMWAVPIQFARDRIWAPCALRWIRFPSARIRFRLPWIPFPSRFFPRIRFIPRFKFIILNLNGGRTRNRIHGRKARPRYR